MTTRRLGTNAASTLEAPEAGAAGLRPWTFITWYPYCRRSDALAEQLGARSHLVHYLKFKVPTLAPLKYLLQSLKTLWILCAERPSLVLVANPPFVAPLVVWMMSRVLGYSFVVDAHSGAFQHSLWRWSLPLQKFLARRALATIVTNDHMAMEVRRWGARVEKVQDLSLNLDPGGPQARRDGFHVVFICTYSVDEPVAEAAEAARLIPDVQFTFTGDPGYAPAGFREGLPSNVRLAGFLPDSDYLALLRGADAILVLTSEDHTMQRGGYEAMSLEKPLITSDWPLLREVFARGTVHVDNTAASIASAVLRIRTDPQSWRRDMAQWKQERRGLSAAQVENLRRVCRAADSPRRSA